MRFNFYADSGHAWLRVPTDLIKRLGIGHSISGYSYMKEGYSYLEEDCDADKFLKELEAQGIKYEISIRRSTWSRVRSYNRFNPAFAQSV